MLSNLVNHVVAMGGAETHVGATTGGISAVTQGINTVMELAGNMLDAIVANPIYLIFFSVSIVGAVLTVFRMVKRSSGK